MVRLRSLLTRRPFDGVVGRGHDGEQVIGHMQDRIAVDWAPIDRDATLVRCLSCLACPAAYGRLLRAAFHQDSKSSRFIDSKSSRFITIQKAHDSSRLKTSRFITNQTLTIFITNQTLTTPDHVGASQIRIWHSPLVYAMVWFWGEPNHISSVPISFS